MITPKIGRLNVFSPTNRLFEQFFAQKAWFLNGFQSVHQGYLRGFDPPMAHRFLTGEEEEEAKGFRLGLGLVGKRKGGLVGWLAGWLERLFFFFGGVFRTQFRELFS